MAIQQEQPKLIVTIKGQQRIVPEANYENLRRICGLDIESAVRLEKKPKEEEKTVIPQPPTTQNITPQVQTTTTEPTDIDKKKQKLTEAGFIFNAGLQTYERGTQSITIEELAIIKPMQLGKFIKPKTN